MQSLGSQKSVLNYLLLDIEPVELPTMCPILIDIMYVNFHTGFMYLNVEQQTKEVYYDIMKRDAVQGRSW